MTSPSFAPLRLITVDTEDTVRIELHGDLDHDNAGMLLAQVTTQLAGRHDLEHLHLHCGGLDTTDSTGLSVLLMIRRRTAEAGVNLHLDDRPAKLDRLLETTGTLEYLTTPAPTDGIRPLRGDATSTARAPRPEGLG
ncbi:STAS domain-containing protein [Kitasatospora sp. NBC_01560]|uniref:STAS domain-containing protein n=1 Tax=Kitasatospora sp. NBC_01560 TaxID=2975965 RepID=UPI003870CF00